VNKKCDVNSTAWLLTSVLLVAECSAMDTFPQKDSSLYKILCVSDLSCQIKYFNVCWALASDVMGTVIAVGSYLGKCLVPVLFDVG